MDETIHVSMLGQFSIRWGESCITDSSNRMKKIWLLLAYLIYTRNSPATQENYITLFRGSGEDWDDPAGRLKALFYRARGMLDQLREDGGHTLINHNGNTYSWNTSVPLDLDVEEFDRLCSLATSQDDEEERLATYRQALDIYKGDFLPKLSTELWVIPISAYYHHRFLTVAENTLNILEERELWQDALTLCTKAINIEPYSEMLYQHLMRCRLKLGDRDGVISAYEELSKLLLDVFGVTPSTESHKLYRAAMRENNDKSIPIDAVREQLREPVQAENAMYCEYDFFKLLYQLQARAVTRSGESIHIALLSVSGFGRKRLSPRSLGIAMENLKQLVISNLRKGDVVSRCSPNQLIVMLSQANYEGSCIACQRVIKTFERQYPHSPAEIKYSVQPLEPAAEPPRE